jgi:hypothetical protein
MSNRARVVFLAGLSLCVALACGSSLAAAQSTQEETTAPSATQDENSKGGNEEDKYQKNFPKEPYVNTGENPYFILQPGYVLKLEGQEE